MGEFDITSEFHRWASAYRLALKPDDPRLKHSVIVIKFNGTTMWLDSAFIVRVEGNVCIFTPDIVYIYNPADLSLCREVIEIVSESFDEMREVPTWI